MNESQLRHVLKSQQFDPSLISRLFNVASSIKSRSRASEKLRLDDEILFTLFYEPSTRTRMSFAVAGQRLGMNVIWTENAKEFSSAIKGETLEDTTRVLCEYRPDAIVLRHHETGAAERAAAVSSVPIINAGDGKGQHPTQALLDLFTIVERFSNIEGLTVAMIGDLLNGRTVRSLSYLLAKFAKVKLIFVSPPELRMADDLKEWLVEKGVEFRETENLIEALVESDVAYCTRIQKERGSDVSEETLARFRIGKTQIEMMKKSAILMHPLPRVNEILPEVDEDPRAVYFEQAGNGMYVRMALLLWVLHKI